MRWLAILAIAACDAPVCELAPASTDAASNVRIEARRIGQPVFVQNRAGDVLFEGVTASDGSFVIDELPADAIVTVDLPGSQGIGRHFTSFFDLQSNETAIVGEREDVAEPPGTASVTVRFDQLPNAARYMVSVGGNCVATFVEHDPAQTMGVATFVPNCAGSARLVTVVAEDAAARALGIATATLDIPTTAPASVEVGDWSTQTARIELAAVQPVRAIEIKLMKGDDLRWFTNLNQPTDAELAVLVPSAGHDATLVKVFLMDGSSYRLRKTTTDDVVIEPTPLRIEALDLAPDEQFAASLAWRYRGAAIAAVPVFSFENGGLATTQVRSGVSFQPGCQLAFPPLPPRYEIPDPPEFESLGVGFINAAGLSREATMQFLAGDLPDDVVISIVSDGERFNRRPTHDPS